MQRDPSIAGVALAPALIDAVNAKAATAAQFLSDIARDYAPVVFANSLGAEDMVLTDLILTAGLGIGMFTIDTGRLPEPTYRLMATLERHYGHRLHVLLPRHDAVETLLAHDGHDGFYASVTQRQACCQVRKVEPLQRALAGQRAWLTGLRAAQSPTRSGLARMAWDEAHGLVKFNPLSHWSEDEVWAYLRLHGVPFNALHEQGYPSIGCAPCTRAVAPGEDVRAGRWWWESPAQKECGLHVVDGRLVRAEQPANCSDGGAAVGSAARDGVSS